MYQVDAFTDQLFGGNPAAICPLESWLPDETMQKIAAENNLSETAFFIPIADPDDFEIRWFTPTEEVDLCGHATLGTAHIIFTELSFAKDEIKFQTVRAGPLIVTRQENTVVYTLDFPSRPGKKVELPDGMLGALRSEKTPVEVYKARDHLLVYGCEADVQRISPDFAALAKLKDVFAVSITAPGDEVDFVSRFFAPGVGVNEDPVCGSSHCTLTPYWVERLGKNPLRTFQISARRGELLCELKGDRVLISGRAVTYLRGEIDV